MKQVKLVEDSRIERLVKIIAKEIGNYEFFNAKIILFGLLYYNSLLFRKRTQV